MGSLLLNTKFLKQQKDIETIITLLVLCRKCELTQTVYSSFTMFVRNSFIFIFPLILKVTIVSLGAKIKIEMFIFWEDFSEQK